MYTFSSKAVRRNWSRVLHFQVVQFCPAFSVQPVVVIN